MEINKEKRTYNTPQVERVELDNEISLILQSSVDDNPLEGPDEAGLLAPQHFNNDPFKTNIG